MHLPTVIALVAGLASAASASSFCSTISEKNCPASATAFCSSYMKVPTKLTTVTVSSAVTRTRTATTVGTTVTSHVAPTSTVYRTVTKFTTSTYTSTPYSVTTTLNTNCIYSRGGSSKQKRAAVTSTSVRQPLCLRSYPSGTALSSACKCFSFHTATSTVTARSTKTVYVTRTATATKTSLTTAHAVTTHTTTFTSTIVDETTATSTATVTEGPSFLLYDDLGVSGAYALIAPFSGADGDPSNPDDGMGVAFHSRGGNDQSFVLEQVGSEPCALVRVDDGADLVGTIPDGDLVNFVPKSPAPHNLLSCKLANEGLSQVFCKSPAGDGYNAGYVDDVFFWHIPTDAGLANATILATFYS